MAEVNAFDEIYGREILVPNESPTLEYIGAGYVNVVRAAATE